MMYAWLLAISDSTLASELLRRMQPNLAEQRAMLAENTINRAIFRLSYIELLDRSASGEGIGRVHRIDGGPFY